MLVSKLTLLSDALLLLFFAAMAAAVSPWYLFGILWVAIVVYMQEAVARRRRHQRMHRHQVIHAGPGSHNVQAGRDVNYPER